MSTAAAEACRLAYERYSAGDFDGLLERWGAVWDEMRIEVQDMESEGDWVLALVHYIGCGTGSGVDITQPVVGAVALAPRSVCARSAATENRTPISALKGPRPDR